MKRALLVSPYFLPSNLACVHRVRVMANELREFGWEPTVLTVDSVHYQESCEPVLNQLIPEGLRVERVPALSSRLCRLLGLGDISLRGYFPLHRKAAELIANGEADLIFVSVLPGYTSHLGSWAKRRFGIPFVLDYQDPWVSDWGVAQPRWSKAGLAHLAASVLEPKVLAYVDAVTAVSDSTLDTLRCRNLLPPSVPVEIIPIGADFCDHELAKRYGRSVIRREGDTFQIVYLGTLTDRMLPAFEAFLAAAAKASKQQSRRVLVHLVGTSGQKEGKDHHNLNRTIERMGLTNSVTVRPGRIGYLDALRTMHDADLLLLIGSTDSHYTASKLFPYWLSGRPLFGLFHGSSDIVALAQQLGGVALICYDKLVPPASRIKETTDILTQIITSNATVIPKRHETAFAPYSAKGIAERYARLFERVLHRCE